MQNFDFCLPTKIVFGRNTIPRIGAELSGAARNILLVYGTGSIKRNGIYDVVCDSLQAASVQWTEFGGVRSNPRLSQIREAVETARNAGVDAVLGVGGGSVVDAAKAIAAGAAGESDVWNYVTGETVEKCLPVYSIITLAATGSELNGISVITNDKTLEKWPIKSDLAKPKTSILDPETTFSVSRAFTAYGGVDAFSHVVEAYLAWPDPSTPLQDGMAEVFARTIIGATDRCVTAPEDYDARAELMWAAALGWSGVIPAGAGNVRLPNHMLEHSLSALYDVPHGAGLSAIIPGWGRYVTRNWGAGKIAKLGRTVFDSTAGDDEQAAMDALAGFEAWCRRIGSPINLRDLEIPAQDLDKITDNAFNTSQAWGMTTPYCRPVIRKILQECY